MPADWDPGDEGRAFAAAQGLTNGRGDAELAKFRDYWASQPGQKGVKADWQATWRNWVRRAAESAGAPPGAAPGARPAPPRKSDALMAGNIAAAQRFLAGDDR